MTADLWCDNRNTSDILLLTQKSEYIVNMSIFGTLSVIWFHNRARPVYKVPQMKVILRIL